MAKANSGKSSKVKSTTPIPPAGVVPSTEGQSSSGPQYAHTPYGKVAIIEWKADGVHVVCGPYGDGSTQEFTRDEITLV